MEFKDIKSTFYSDIHLNKWVEKISKSAIYETLFGVIIYLFFTIKMYFGESPLDFWFFSWLLVSSLFLVLYIYGGTFKRGKIINNTVKSISFDKNYTSIITFSYKILFLKKLDSKIIRIQFDKLILKDDTYPILDKKNINGRVVKISDQNGNSYYIILKFFSEDLLNNLN